MIRKTKGPLLRATLLSAMAWVSAGPAFGLMRWNEGRDQIHVSIGAAYMYDSNIFTNSAGVEDNVISGNVGIEYRRKAGLIGVNADVGVGIANFQENVDESFSNPSMRLEFTKDAGRTTGTLGFSGMRTSRADPAVNARTDSWNYGSELRVKYPINDRHSIAAGVDWLRQDYENNDLFVDIDTASLSADWFYVFTPERDIFSGYRLRINETSVGDRYADHSVSVGIAGRLIRGLNGTARFGAQTRTALSGTNDDYTGYNSSLSATWSFTRAVALTGRISRDLNITSTNISTEVFSGNLDLQYARSAKLVFSAGVGGGTTEYLGDLGGGREDTYFTYYGRVRYTFSEKLSIGAAYNYFRNWSTLSFADFERDSITFDASSRF